MVTSILNWGLPIIYGTIVVFNFALSFTIERKVKKDTEIEKLFNQKLNYNFFNKKFYSKGNAIKYKIYWILKTLFFANLKSNISNFKEIVHFEKNSFIKDIQNVFGNVSYLDNALYPIFISIRDDYFKIFNKSTYSVFILKKECENSKRFQSLTDVQKTVLFDKNLKDLKRIMDMGIEGGTKLEKEALDIAENISKEVKSIKNNVIHRDENIKTITQFKSEIDELSKFNKSSEMAHLLNKIIIGLSKIEQQFLGKIVTSYEETFQALKDLEQELEKTKNNLKMETDDYNLVQLKKIKSKY